MTDENEDENEVRICGQYVVSDNLKAAKLDEIFPYKFVNSEDGDAIIDWLETSHGRDGSYFRNDYFVISKKAEWSWYPFQSGHIIYIKTLELFVMTKLAVC